MRWHSSGLLSSQSVMRFGHHTGMKGEAGVVGHSAVGVDLILSRR
ncbi:MAG: hypothetical protein P8Y45_14710 [Exilibacterium sp.]